MSLNDIQPSIGKILISEPFLQDFYFRRSVVLLADHSEEGSFGIIMNKATESPVNYAIDDFPQIDAPLYLGGPVQTNSLFYIHRFGEKIEGSIIIKGQLAWGGDLDQVKQLILEGKLTANDIRFFVGYAGWSPSQLDEELSRNSWVVSGNVSEDLLDFDPKKMWGQSLQDVGGRFRDWVNFPLDPALN